MPFWTNNSNILGTQTNDNAATGFVGEQIESTLASGSPVSLTTATTANVTSISLTAGDWNIDGVVNYTFGATTSVTRALQAASTTTAGFSDNDKRSSLAMAATVLGSAVGILQLPIIPYRLSLNATTTVFLVTNVAFTVSTASAYGYIRARRVR